MWGEKRRGPCEREFFYGARKRRGIVPGGGLFRTNSAHTNGPGRIEEAGKISADESRVSRLVRSSSANICFYWHTKISASTGTAVGYSLGDIPANNPGDKLARSNGDVEPPTFSARAGVFCAD